MKTKKILIIFLLIICFSLAFKGNIVQAALQANGNEPAKKNRNTWMEEIRKMESLGGTLGLLEQQDTDLTYTGESNSLDIHMQKNTEYGAMALLSASSYGNPEIIEKDDTTTGNVTGVVIPNNAEWTAAQYTDHIGKTATYADRYINYYSITNGPTIMIGDALLETKGWHKSTSIYYMLEKRRNTGVVVEYSYYHDCVGGIVRNYNQNGIFGFANSRGGRLDHNDNLRYDTTNNCADLSNSYTSRAVIINGKGI